MATPNRGTARVTQGHFADRPANGGSVGGTDSPFEISLEMLTRGCIAARSIAITSSLEMASGEYWQCPFQRRVCHSVAGMERLGEALRQQACSFLFFFFSFFSSFIGEGEGVPEIKGLALPLPRSVVVVTRSKERRIVVRKNHKGDVNGRIQREIGI
jgi:hypothetical protein